MSRTIGGRCIEVTDRSRRYRRMGRSARPASTSQRRTVPAAVPTNRVLLSPVNRDIAADILLGPSPVGRRASANARPSRSRCPGSRPEPSAAGIAMRRPSGENPGHTAVAQAFRRLADDQQGPTRRTGGLLQVPRVVDRDLGPPPRRERTRRSISRQRRTRASRISPSGRGCGVSFPSSDRDWIRPAPRRGSHHGRPDGRRAWLGESSVSIPGTGAPVLRVPEPGGIPRDRGDPGVPSGETERGHCAARSPWKARRDSPVRRSQA